MAARLTPENAKVVEELLLAHILLLALDDAERKGFEVRSDVITLLNRSVVSVLSKTHDAMVQRLATEADNLAKNILGAVSLDDPQDYVQAIATFVSLVASEGLIEDNRHQAVLISLLILDDARDEEPDDKGFLPVYSLRQTICEQCAKAMLQRARLAGYFTVQRLQLTAQST